MSARIASERSNPDAFVLFERALQIVRERALPPLEEAITLQAYADASRVAGDEEGAAEYCHRVTAGFAEAPSLTGRPLKARYHAEARKFLLWAGCSG